MGDNNKEDKKRCFGQKRKVIPQSLESGKEKRHLEEPQYDEPRTGFSVPMSSSAATPSAQFLGHDTLFSTPPGALSSESAGILKSSEWGSVPPDVVRSLPRVITPEQGFSIKDFPLQSITPKPIRPPRFLDVGGYVYQLVDPNHREDLTTSFNGHPGEYSLANKSLLHEHQNGQPGLDQKYSSSLQSSNVQLDQQSAGDRVLRTERQLTPNQQNLGPGLTVKPNFRQLMQKVHESGLFRHRSTSTDVQVTDCHASSPTVRNAEDQAKKIHELEPHIKLEQHEPEPALETYQPTDSPSLLVTLKTKRRSSMLNELKAHDKPPGHNDNPDSGSDSEPVVIRRRAPRKSKAKSSSRSSARRSQLLREIEDYNKSPEAEDRRELAMARELEDGLRHIPLTREARKNIMHVARNTRPQPRKDLNLKKLMKAEFNGAGTGTKRFQSEGSSDLSHYKKQRKDMTDLFLEDEEDDGEETLPKISKTHDQGSSQSIPRPPLSPRQVGKVAGSVENEYESSSSAESAWLTWDSRKETINRLIKSPQYNPAHHVTAEVPEDFDGKFRVENDLHIFSPTLATFLDFGRFLRVVEEIAGRKIGVVKVLVPCGWTSEMPEPSRRRMDGSPGVQIVNISMDLGGDEVYDMITTHESIQETIEQWLDSFQVDEESHLVEPCEKEILEIVRKKSAAVSCALNQPATANFRAALGFQDPHIDNLLGNRFASSTSTQAGINESVFNIASSSGPLSPLQTNKYAAYSINYHHSGAPRILTVTPPEHHAKLEDVMHTVQDNESLFGRPTNPPRCSQFVSHNPVYAPQATLSSYGIANTEVVQQQGEMVITFPYAYHQVLASGPSITEEILYASDRCKVFHQKDLYQHCKRECTPEKQDEFDLRGVFTEPPRVASNPHKPGM